jgi:hypothetical protein
MAFRLLPVCFGKECPRCARRMDRIPFPLSLSLFRLFARGHLTFRECLGCGWRGCCLHRDRSRRMSRSASPAR